MRSVLVLALWLICGVVHAQPAAVPDKTPEDLIRFVYSHYAGKSPSDDPSFPWSSPPLVDRLFEPALARAVLNAGKSPDLVIGADPFVDAQDFQIASFDLKTEQKSKDSARITANFVNMTEPRAVTYSLRRLKPGWRIYDISWGRAGQSFRRMMKVR